MVIADGMGGHLHGEVAAQIATQYIAEAFQREAQPRIADPFKFLLDSITNAHHAIVDYANVRSLLETPRTTVVGCIIQDGLAHWAHVGDSRLYLIRNGKVEAQTKDHSRVQILVDAGRVREEAIAAHPDRNKIFNCLGQMGPPKVDLSRRVALRHGDVIMLCSDGVWGPLHSRHICEEFLRNDVMRAVPILIDMAEARAGKDGDNASVVALGWSDDTGSASGDEISTVSMDPTELKTTVEQFGRSKPPAPQGGYLTDDEIERAIDEIRNAIKRHTK
jgi:serine/threonine protein phosphatase PrpC